MCGEMALTNDRFDRAIENIDEPLRVLAMGVAAHRRFIDRDLRATGPDKSFELGAYEWK
jgi:hypothetical protein